VEIRDATPGPGTVQGGVQRRRAPAARAGAGPVL